MATGSREPAWGVGIGYRPHVHHRLMQGRVVPDFAELAIEDYIVPERRAAFDKDGGKLAEIVARMPVVAHSFCVSIGSTEPPAPTTLERTLDFVAEHPIASFSEHLQFNRAGDLSIGCFLSLPFTELGIEIAVRNIRALQARLGLPVLVENVAAFFYLPEPSMSEAEFLTRVSERANCGILLDVANAWINSRNFRFDLHEFIGSLPAHRIQQAHFCGGEILPDGFILDSHRQPAAPAVWGALEFALRSTALSALILERDARWEAFEEVESDLERAGELFQRFSPRRESTVLRAPTAAATFATPEQFPEQAIFQHTLLRMLHDADLCDAVDREGPAALAHTGLGSEERRVLAAISGPHRDRLAFSVRGRAERPQHQPTAEATT